MKQKSFRRKEALLQAALDEFCLQSYEEASLNTILKNAAVSKGNFYYHFADKQSLYLSLLDDAVKTKWNYIRTKMNSGSESPVQSTLFEQFKLQARLAAQFAAQYPQYHQLGLRFSKERGTPIYAAAKEFLGGSTEDVLAGMIDAAVARGDIKQSYPREYLLKTITYLFNGFDEIFDSNEDFELHNMLKNLDSYVDFIQHGIGN